MFGRNQMARAVCVVAVLSVAASALGCASAPVEEATATARAVESTPQPTLDLADPTEAVRIAAELEQVLAGMGRVLGGQTLVDDLLAGLNLDETGEGVPAFVDLQAYGTFPVQLSQEWLNELAAAACQSAIQALKVNCSFDPQDPAALPQPGQFFLTIGAWNEPFPQQGRFCFFGDIVTVPVDLPAIEPAYPGDPEGGASFVVQAAYHPTLNFYGQVHGPEAGLQAPVITFELVEPDAVARAILWAMPPEAGAAEDAQHQLESGCYDLEAQDAPPVVDILESGNAPLPRSDLIVLVGPSLVDELE